MKQLIGKRWGGGHWEESASLFVAKDFSGKPLVFCLFKAQSPSGDKRVRQWPLARPWG